MSEGPPDVRGVSRRGADQRGVSHRAISPGAGASTETIIYLHGSTVRGQIPRPRPPSIDAATPVTSRAHAPSAPFSHTPADARGHGPFSAGMPPALIAPPQSANNHVAAVGAANRGLQSRQITPVERSLAQGRRTPSPLLRGRAKPNRNKNIERHELEISDARRVPGAEERRVEIPTEWISQFKDPFHVTYADLIACFQTAKAMTLSPIDGARPSDLLGKDGRIVVSRGADAKGRIQPDRDAAKSALAYIDRMLDQHRRVLVGVTHRRDYPHEELDTGTDHYLTIVGRSYEDVEADAYFPTQTSLVDSDSPAPRSRRVVYKFLDPAFGVKSASNNYGTGKLYVDDETGILFRPRRPGSAHTPYELTQVRLYKE